MDLRQHPSWPDLADLGRAARAARARLLDLWPEDTDPAEFDPRRQLELEQAHTAVTNADSRYRALLKQMQDGMDQDG